MAARPEITRRIWVRLALLLAAGAAFYFFRDSTEEKPDVKQSPNREPLIGVASIDSEPYLRAVREAGGVPIVLPTDSDAGKIEKFLEELDGLLLPGGADIPPSDYGEAPHEMTRALSRDRAQFEKALGLAWLRRTDKPLLGICLGCQWINVLEGGTLIQDIPSELGGTDHYASHPAELVEGSRLREIFGKARMEVNSNHHQAAESLGQGLRVSARCPSGVVEAIESTRSDRFLIGVQWHPEEMTEQDPSQAKLYRAFVEAAAETAARKTGKGKP